MATPKPPAPTLKFDTTVTTGENVAQFSATTSSITELALTGLSTTSVTLESWVNATSAVDTDTVFALSDSTVALSMTKPSSLTVTVGTEVIDTGVALGTGLWRHIALIVQLGTNGALTVTLVLDAVTVFLTTKPGTTVDALPTAANVTLGAFGSGTALQGVSVLIKRHFRPFPIALNQ